MAIAWVFLGQGSQWAWPISCSDPMRPRTLRHGLRAPGGDLLAICKGEAEEKVWMISTIPKHPASAVRDRIPARGWLRAQQRDAALVAGHSLGEPVALYAAMSSTWDGREADEAALELMATAGVAP